MTKTPRPGEFRDAPSPDESTRQRTDPAEDESRSPRPSKELVRSYQLFREYFQPKTGVIYYPSCGYDTSATVAFPGSRVIYVDLDTHVVGELQGIGLEVHRADALEYKPDLPVDIAVLQNPQFGSEGVKQIMDSIKEGGYLFCNNYLRTAFEASANQNFELVAAIKTPNDNEPMQFDTNPSRDYLEPVGSPENKSEFVFPKAKKQASYFVFRRKIQSKNQADLVSSNN